MIYNTHINKKGDIKDMSIISNSTKKVARIGLNAGMDTSGATKVVSFNLPAISPQNYDMAKLWGVYVATYNMTNYEGCKLQLTDTSIIEDDA